MPSTLLRRWPPRTCASAGGADPGRAFRLILVPLQFEARNVQFALQRDQDQPGRVVRVGRQPRLSDVPSSRVIDT